MSQTDFRFKQFTVLQDKCAMKVGTDGVLLGAWTNPKNSKFILDIGTGTGLIALMLAQKSDAVIDAIDMDENATLQAAENFRNSPWTERLRAIHQSLQYFAAHTTTRYDLIVSNPPYFIGAYDSPSSARNIARHMDAGMNIVELTECVIKLLKPDGRFCVILPFIEGMKFREYSEKHGLFAFHITKVKTKVEKQEKRIMMEMGLHKKDLIEDELVIQEEDLSFTKAYLELTNDYYLGLPKKRN